MRDGQIPSRRAGTDAAVCSAVLSANPKRVLDVGCGEGWLARALTAHGCQVIGVDASPELIASARALGGGRFEVMSCAELGSTAHTLGGPFDVAVCNFSLLGEDITFVFARLVTLSAGTDGSSSRRSTLGWPAVMLRTWMVGASRPSRALEASSRRRCRGISERRDRGGERLSRAASRWSGGRSPSTRSPCDRCRSSCVVVHLDCATPIRTVLRTRRRRDEVGRASH